MPFWGNGAAPGGVPGAAGVLSDAQGHVLGETGRRLHEAVAVEEGAAEQVLRAVLVVLAARRAEPLAVLDGALHEPVGRVLHALRGLRGEGAPPVAAGVPDVRHDPLGDEGRLRRRDEALDELPGLRTASWRDRVWTDV